MTTAMTLLAIVCQARVIRVNSVPTFATSCADCYTSLPSAISAALDNDTIHLEPADANYGDATINKRLVIIGAGYLLGPNPSNPDLQANTQSSRVNLLTLNSNTSQGTVLMGLHFANQFGGLSISNTSNIRVLRNFFDDGLDIDFPSGGTGVSDILVAENLISGSVTHSQFAQVVTNLTIRNNIIATNLSFAEDADVITNLSVLNNTFLYNGNHSLKNAEVAFNVFYQGNITGANNTIHDNISAIALTGGDASNQVVNMGNVYNLTLGTDDSKYDILPSSPFDEDEDDARGAFSGISPYRLSGIPNIPTIYTLQSTLNTVPGGSVEVTLSTRTNN